MRSKSETSLHDFFDQLAPQRDKWIAKNAYYYEELYCLHEWLVENNKRVLDIGCGTGNLLSRVKPKEGVGIDFSFEMVKIASQKFPEFNFQVMDGQHLEFNRKFDYILMSNLVGYVDDVWQTFRSLRSVCHERSRIVITNYNYFWQPVMALAEKLGRKMPDRIQNWLPQEFIEHFLYLNGFTVVKKGKFLHLPLKLGGLAKILNRLFAQIPLLNSLALIEYLVAQPVFLHEKTPTHKSVTVIVPTHQEMGNVDTIVDLMPQIGDKTELIFVNLPGTDGTADKIKQRMKSYTGKLKIKYLEQSAKTGKIGALRLGVKAASGEIILIYDADVTVPPQDLIKLYLALVEKKSDIINGTRLVYPTEKGAMRFINHLGNLIFARLFTWTLGQHFTDTLCGSKGFWKKDFLEFEKTKIPIDNLDRYGDFYLLMGAYRRNLKIAEVPVRYKTRRYGDTKLNRVLNGWQFLRIFVYFFWYYKVLQRRDL